MLHINLFSINHTKKTCTQIQHSNQLFIFTLYYFKQKCFIQIFSSMFLQHLCCRLYVGNGGVRPSLTLILGFPLLLFLASSGSHSRGTRLPFPWLITMGIVTSQQKAAAQPLTALRRDVSLAPNSWQMNVAYLIQIRHDQRPYI